MAAYLVILLYFLLTSKYPIFTFLFLILLCLSYRLLPKWWLMSNMFYAQTTFLALLLSLFSIFNNG